MIESAVCWRICRWDKDIVGWVCESGTKKGGACKQPQIRQLLREKGMLIMLFGYLGTVDRLEICARDSGD